MQFHCSTMEVPELVVAKGGAKLKELALDPSTSDSGAIESMRRVGRKIGDERRSSVRLWRRSGDQFEWRGRGACRQKETLAWGPGDPSSHSGNSQ